MAKSLIRVMPVVLARCGVVLLALVVSAAAHAEESADPTRPPAAFIQATSSSMPGVPVAGPVLQSVVISPQRSVATINGQRLMVGDKVGDATVTRIGETEVVLRSGKALQTLKLFPTIDRRAGAGKILLKPAATDRNE